MKRLYKNKKIFSFLFITILCSVLSFTTKVSAADEWIFSAKTQAVVGPFETEELCKASQAVWGEANITVHCYKKQQSVPVDAQKTGTQTSGVYNLLAPIGNITSFQTNNLGTYFNMIFKLAIGLCAALAVIMIIISSIQYMGDESVFGKTEAKSKIISAIMGLLIALGAYALLNTLNPALTGSGGLNVNQVITEIEDQPLGSNDPIPPGGATTVSCPEGIDFNVITTGGVFPACKTISARLKAMINQAWADGYKISGYGFRSKDKQIALRTAHCGASNVYNAKAVCTPPTALPGTSMHESGLAFDLRCDGVSIQSQDNRCFLWLKANASKYGLKNLNSEPWHWSTTGH